MSETVVQTPIDLIRFLSLENENLLVSIRNNEKEMFVISHIQGLYHAALDNVHTSEENAVLYQLLSFTHYHFLFCSSCLMRCHLSEALSSARSAIDAALISSKIIKDRNSRTDYVNGTGVFKHFSRYLGNLERNSVGDHPLHPLVPRLRSLHKSFSSYGSHADMNVFVHRMKFDQFGSPMFGYFQFPQCSVERQTHSMNLYIVFVMVLDMFSDFLVDEERKVPEEWRQELRRLGATVEHHVSKLRDISPHAEGGDE